MEVRRPPVFRRVVLFVSALLASSYGWHTFVAAGAGGCWALPFGPAAFCDARTLGFVVATAAVVAAMGTLFVAIVGLGSDEVERPRRSRRPAASSFRAPPMPPTSPPSSPPSSTTMLDSGRLDELLKRATSEAEGKLAPEFSVELDGRTFTATSLPELREELRRHSGYTDAQIEEILRMFGDFH